MINPWLTNSIVTHPSGVVAPLAMQIFQDVIQRDPDICNNCFRRVRDRYEMNYVVDQFEGELWVRELDMDMDEVYRTNDSVRMPHDEMTHGEITACACGWRDEPNRPLDTETFLEYAERLYDRLDESGLRISRTRFFEELESLKRDPDEQFADDRLYGRAIKRCHNERRI